MSSVNHLRVQRAERGEIDPTIGQRIRRLRQERGMSLAQLGGQDLSRSFLSLVELGKSRISLRALSIVADRLEMPMSYFLEGGVTGDATMELLLDQAEVALTRNDPARAVQLLEGIEVGRRLRPRFIWLHSMALVNTGRAREALPELREGLALAERTDDFLLTTRIRYTLGAALYAVGAFDEALVHLRRSLDHTVLGPEDPALTAKITVCIGHILYARGDSDGAVEYYTRASELYGSMRDLNTLACVYSGLSLAYERKGDMSNALRYSKLSLGAFEAQHNVLQSARELNNLGVRYLTLGDEEQALRCAREAVERSQQVGGREVEALARSTMASVYLRQERYEEAAASAEEAIHLADHETPLAKIDAWVVLATLADRQGEGEHADQFYQQALEAARVNDLEAKYADIALAYSLSLKRRGNVDRALEFALEAAQGRPARTG